MEKIVSDLKVDENAGSPAKPTDVQDENSQQDETDSKHISILSCIRGSRPSENAKIPRRVLPNAGVSHDDEAYFMRNPKRGVALIFNHYKFDTREYRNGELYRPPIREGTKADTDTLSETFSNLGFEVECLDDKSYMEIKKKLAELARQDHSDCDCVAVAVLTHGESGGRLDARDQEYDTRELWEPFVATSCGTLASKPKLFFIQACKGRMRDHGAMVANAVCDCSDAAPSRQSFFQVPSYADILISFSTFEGLYAFRHPMRGSWYVQTLCSQLGINAGSKDLVSLLTYVNRIVGQEFRSVNSDKGMDGLVQGPCFISSLTRLVHLSPPAGPAGVDTTSFFK